MPPPVPQEGPTLTTAVPDGLSPLFIDQGGGEEGEEAAGVEGCSSSSAPHDDVYRVEDDHSKSVWVTAGVALGNILDWYDMAVCDHVQGAIAPVVTKSYWDFATDDAVGGAVLGTGIWFWFVSLPVGMLLAHRGDLHGNRKRVLRLSILLMVAASVATGSLPPGQQVGSAAAVTLFKVTRIIRGAASVVQLASSAVFFLENRDPTRWGLLGSFVLAAAYFGHLLGRLVGLALVQNLSNEQLVIWGWRLPFWGAGILASPSVFWLRPRDGDGQDASRPNQENRAQHNPLRVAFARKNWRSLAAAAMVPAFVGGGYRLYFSSTLPIMLLLSGYLADRFGGRLVMTIGGVCTLVISPWLYLSGFGMPGVLSFASLSLMGIFLAFWIAPVPAWLVSSFEPAARLTSVTLGYNASMVIFRGFSTMLAAALNGNVYSPRMAWIIDAESALIISGLAVISLFGLWCVAPQKVRSTQPIGGS